VLSVLARKVNVLCERPIALTSRGVERILAAATRADRQVAVANNHRFRSDVQALESFFHGGELGRVLAIRAGSYHADRPDGWRARRAEAGGGVFLEHGLPLLDLALWLADFPAPERVTAHMDRTRGGGSAVEDGMFVHLECANALSCSLDVSWSYVGEEDRWWFEVLATRGSARLSPLRVVKLLNGRATDVSPTGAAARESVFLQSYRAELAHFIAALRGEAEYEAPTDQTVVLRVLEGIYRSADDGKEIKL
jgi:predicted dehydrogenase